MSEPSDPDPIAELQSVLGHEFADPAILERALVHRSWAHDQTPPVPDNERLEFLGDAVLGLVVAEHLFDAFAHDEGRLTRARANLVKREHLAECARNLDLARWLHLGRGEAATGGREKDSILCDLYEAVLGAVYRDGGLPAARAFVERTMGAALERRGADGGAHSPRDPRTVLQERLQRAGLGTPRYKITGSEGPPHAPIWTQEVRVGGDLLGCGSGRSKQQAAREAARQALAGLDAPP